MFLVFRVEIPQAFHYSYLRSQPPILNRCTKLFVNFFFVVYGYIYCARFMYNVYTNGLGRISEDVGSSPKSGVGLQLKLRKTSVTYFTN